jgi:hypothetical protein
MDVESTHFRENATGFLKRNLNLGASDYFV